MILCTHDYVLSHTKPKNGFIYWHKGELGYWAKPDSDHLAEIMRWIYENQEIANSRGMDAARWLRENQTWRETAVAMQNILQPESMTC